VGGSLGVLLKASRVQFLSLVTIFFAATITDGGGQNEGEAERGGSLPPYILHSSVYIYIYILQARVFAGTGITFSYPRENLSG
jgi:uncharacterized membrane protein YadS